MERENRRRSAAEVVASRLLWAAGYHQPPTYYLPQRRLVGGPEPGVKGPARFRPKVDWLDRVGVWPCHRNPFVATQPFRGVIALNLMLNNADLRTPNNIIYDLPIAGERRDTMVCGAGPGRVARRDGLHLRHAERAPRFRHTRPQSPRRVRLPRSSS